MNKWLFNDMAPSKIFYVDIRILITNYQKKKKLRGLSPQAWSAQRIPTAVKFGFLDRSRYLSIQVAPQLSSRG
jgi:hypothetical protein